MLMQKYKSHAIEKNVISYCLEEGHTRTQRKYVTKKSKAKLAKHQDKCKLNAAEKQIIQNWHCDNKFLRANKSILILIIILCYTTCYEI